MKIDLFELLSLSIKNNASDLHLSSGMPPMIRIDGEIHPLGKITKTVMPVLDSKQIQNWINPILNHTHYKNSEHFLEIDFSFEMAELSRFRVNVFNQQNGLSAVFRIIPIAIPTLESLGLPAIFRDIINYTSGLILITGPTGCGKSTTLAALVNYINHSKHYHILTIEDPIEFIYKSQKSLVHQREVKTHSLSFESALRAGLREDPDVIVVGELRDLETIKLALTAAETGHLVLATLHTQCATKTIDRIIDVFPGSEKELIRKMLSESLQAVISQTLIKKREGGRVAAHEIMICNTAIRNLIKENKIPQMVSTLQTNQNIGMQTLDQSLKKLVENGIITQEEIIAHAVNK